MMEQPKHRIVKTIVIAVLSDCRQVRVKTDDGFQYAITDKTPGVNWKELHPPHKNH